MNKILGISSGGGKATKPYTIVVYKNNRNRSTKYEIYYNDLKIIRTDTEEKARAFAEIVDIGINFGIKLVKKHA